MKKIALITGFYFLIANIFGQTIDIKEAITKKKIEYSLEGSWNRYDKQEYLDAEGQYFGKCMRIKVRSKSKNTIDIGIENGLMLMCEDTSTQNMIVTKPIYVTLNPRQTKIFQLYAMCSEIHDNVPNTLTKYRIGKMADSNLIAITRVINDMFMHNVVGQGAIWAYTDKATEDDLRRYGTTSQSLPLTVSILESASVETKLNPRTSILADTTNIQLTESLSTEITDTNTFAINKYLVYAICSILLCLFGTTIWQINKNRLTDNNKDELV